MASEGCGARNGGGWFVVIKFSIDVRHNEVDVRFTNMQ